MPTRRKAVAICLVIGWLFAGWLSGGAWAAAEVLWQQNFGSTKTGPVFAGAEVVHDSLAASGKSLQLAFTKPGPLPPIATAQKLTLAGAGVIHVWVRGKGLNDVANGLRLNVALDRQTTPGGRFQAAGAVYGVRVSEGAYRRLPIHFVVGDKPGSYTLNITPDWQAQSGDRKPTVWIDRIELEGHGQRSPYIGGLLRTKTMYAPGTPVQIAVTVVNPLQEAFAGRLVVDDLAGLNVRRRAADTVVSVAPGGWSVVDMTWEARGPEAGHEVQFALLDRHDKELDRDQIDVGITTNGQLLHFPTLDFESGRQFADVPNSHLFYVHPASYTESKNSVRMLMRDRENRNGRMEFFSWSWCDLAGFVPPEDPYLGNAEHPWWLSLKEYKQQISLLKAAGIHVQSYILGCALGEPAYELYQRHPDWFVHDRNGGGFEPNMETHARYARRHEFEFVQSPRHSVWAAFDPTRPEVRRWIADQIIPLGKEMGFDGVRWDVWWMNVYPGVYRLDGTEIAPTLKEADRLSAESLRALKALVAEELPSFSWGFNCSSPEENKNYPLRLAEMCKGHAWMLDELAIMCGQKTSPHHYWDAYRKRFIEWGDHIRRLGGIYDPWCFNRGFDPAKHLEVDWIHSTIFRILSGGRSWMAFYKNNAALVGDLPRMAFRFSDTFSGWNLRWQPEDQRQIVVDAPSTLWWKGSVFRNRSPEGKEQAIVHLVNSPVTEEIGENKDSKVRPPVRNVQVRCNAIQGRLPQKAWLVTAESLTPEAEPKVQAVPLQLAASADAVAVTVPAVLYLKTVVFEF